MKKQVTVILICVFCSTLTTATPDQPDGVFSITPVLERSCVAVRIPVGLTQALSGVRWFNNDGATVYPKVLVASGLRDVPPLYSDGIIAAADISGGESAWSTIDFHEPLGSETMTLYVIFQLPPNSESSGVGEGPGIGYVASEVPATIYVSDDGDEWSRLVTGYQLLVEPVYTDRGDATLALKCSLGDEEPVAKEPDGVPEAVVTRTEMLPPYPNPFNPSATVVFTLVRPARASISVYDLRGRLVKVLASGHHGQGRHEVVWHGKDGHGQQVASGVYFVRMQAGDLEQIRRIVMVK